MLRVARSVVIAVVFLVVGAGAALAADDTEPPVGTLTINDGSGFANDLDLTLHVPATDNVGVVSVTVYVDASPVGTLPYADSIPFTLADGGDRTYVLYVEWRDAVGNVGTSNGTELVLDRVAPTLGTPTLVGEPDLATATYHVSAPAADSTALAWVRFSGNGTTWGAPIAWADPVDWPALDPAFGGSSRLGARTVYVQVGDGARNWSTTRTLSVQVLSAAPLAVSPDVPKTGHTITITPTWPHAVTFPSGTSCMWEVMWGNDQSLYYGNRDSTFGFFMSHGSATKGFCKPLSFTLPWMQYPQVLVHYEVELPGEASIDEWIGSSPDEPAIVPVIDSTSRRITSSSIPLVYVLPDDYILVVGEPTTYRAYAVGGATIGSHDTWSVDYGDNPEQQVGGSSFTFVPRRTGYLTICWNSDTTVNTRWSACYDPPAKYPDRTRPHTGTPVARIGTGAVGTSMPVTVTWTGGDTGWGIDHYALQRSKDGGAWTTVHKAKTKTWNGSLPVGHDYRFRVRAIDKAGNTGYWDVGPTVRPRVSEDTSSLITWSASWTTVADATARGGSLRESATAGATARITVTARDIAWIAETGPGHGRASVYVDGVLATTVDLAGSTDSPRRIVYRRHWSSVGSHTLKVVVEGTPGRELVGIDGFVRIR